MYATQIKNKKNKNISILLYT